MREKLTPEQQKKWDAIEAEYSYEIKDLNAWRKTLPLVGIFQVYILECRTKNHLYVGQTLNLKKRLEQHRKTAKSLQSYIEGGSYWFIQKHGFKKLLEQYPVNSREEALALELYMARELVKQGRIVNCGVTFRIEDGVRVWFDVATGAELRPKLQNAWNSSRVNESYATLNAYIESQNLTKS